MERYQLIVIVNDLKEHNLRDLTGKRSASISKIKSLIDPLNKNKIMLNAQGASCENVLRYIEDFIHLSYLKPIQLDIIYSSAYDRLTEKFAGNQDSYLHFYDQCVKRNNITRLNAKFMIGSELNLISVEHHKLQQFLAEEHKENCTESDLRQTISVDFSETRLRQIA